MNFQIGGGHPPQAAAQPVRGQGEPGPRQPLQIVTSQPHKRAHAHTRTHVRVLGHCCNCNQIQSKAVCR